MNEEIQEKDSLILIVDDVPKNIQLLGKILDIRGYRVVAVTKGALALNAAKKHSPDLILLDIMMPGKSGFEVCRELKADEELSNIPVIFLTALSEDEDVIRGLNLGGADYVTKPFNSGELVARVATHLSLKKARDQIIRQKEELKQIVETREKLYAIIAHDLKGALFGISVLSETVAEEIIEQPVDDDIKEYAKLISDSATSANLILVNLLAWTNLQSGRLNLDPEEFSLIEEIEECIRLYQMQAKKKSVEIRFEPEVDNKIVLADKQMISTVVRNLISNAIKFSNNGDRITMQVTKTDEGLKLLVKDQGVGMTEETRQNIFDPENRPNKRGTNQECGIGLGLLLCKEFIEAHNGEIRINSEPGKGSEFSFILPREITM